MKIKKQQYIGGAVIAVIIALYYTVNVKMTKVWRFSDNYFSEGKLGFTGTTKPPFKKGQRVTIEQDAGAKFEEYNGTTTVTRVYKDGQRWIVEVSYPRKGDTPANSGRIIG